MTELVPAALKNEFQTALNSGHLTLHYQPIVNMKTGALQGLEALMRWNHPVHGPISPGVFIPMAEETGLIIDASKWALKESCRALKRIEGRTGQNRNLFISVNFSARDFAEDSFLEDLYTIISASDVLPNQIQLEINDELLMSQPDVAQHTLELCRKAGLKIALDDYATASDPLGLLTRFPLDTVKIDNILSKNLTNLAELVQTAAQRGVMVIAERVETADEMAHLRALGCAAAQGFYFSKPLPERDVTDLILNPQLFAGKVA